MTSIFSSLKKQEQKEKNRWSLSDWLEQRDRMRLMDLWLAIHSPSPYEFSAAVTYLYERLSNNSYVPNWNVSISAYASIFGIEAQRDFSTVSDRWTGIFNFRLFGFHDQGTNITLQAGAKDDVKTPVWNPLAGVRMTLYLTKYFGVEGLYRYYFADKPGYRYEGGAFIDFKFLRIYGGYSYESQNASISTDRRAIKFGGKLFF